MINNPTNNVLGGKVGGADFSQVFRLQRALLLLRAQVGQAALQVQPEFGAYMHYSGYIENGTHNKDGSWKMPPRPHIVPAVLKGMPVIAQHLATASGVLTKAFVDGLTPNVADFYRKAWLQVLNDPIRIEAARNAPFQYSFHRRSIHGYDRHLTDSEIKATQQKAMAERAKMVAAARAKKAKK